MRNLEKCELVNVYGGINISGTFVSSIAKGINTVLDLGRSLGSAIRRISSNKYCAV